MRLEVAFSPLGLGPGDFAGRTVLVIDVLRATSSICAALHHGARAVIAAADTEEATRLAHTLDKRDVVLAGERNSVRIPGFALGNSPAEFTREAVLGKTVVLTTTNGTRALLGTGGAREVIVASGLNLSAAGARAREALEQGHELLLLCAGRENGYGMDDAYVAGRLAVLALGGRRTRKGLNDAAISCVDLVRRYGDRMDRVLALSQAGRELVARGFGADLTEVARIDACPVVPLFHERRIALQSPGRG